MDNTQKMLQAIIHDQNTIKQELVAGIRKVDKKVEKPEERPGSAHQ